MIISTRAELNSLLPSNVLSSPDGLLTLMEQTERTYIIPVLGKKLYDAVQEEYDKLRNGKSVDADGKTIDVDKLLATESDGSGYHYTPMQQLIRLLQVPIIYMTLANNPGLLSVSLNNSGINMVSADNYDTAGKDSREAFAKDCYLNAHRGIEQVLLFLEEDAGKDAPDFLKLWMKSGYFYRQNGLLLRSALEFDRYVPISESREMFLSLVPLLRNIQDNRLRPVIGDTLLNALVQFATFGPKPLPDNGFADSTITQKEGKTEKETINEWDKVSSCMISDEAFDEDLREFFPVRKYDGMKQEEKEKLRIWNKALTLLRSALAYYVEDGVKKLKRPSSVEDASSCMDRAMKFISANQSAFTGVIEKSPLFVKNDNSEADSGNGQVNNRDFCSSVNPEPSYISDPFETFYC